jgi:hypothetical protein
LKPWSRRANSIASAIFALQSSKAYFNSPLIKPLARRGAKRALARAFERSRQ